MSLRTILSAKECSWLCDRFPGGKALKWLASQTNVGTLGSYNWVLTEIGTDSRLGFAYPVVDANALRALKDLNGRKICINLSGTKEYTLQPIMSNNRKSYPAQSNSLMENQNGEIKHWLSKTGR